MTLLEPGINPDVETGTGKPDVTHIVRAPGESAINKVYEARMFGYTLEALCGEKFIPQKDPSKNPLCSPCKEIYEMYKQFNGFDGDPEQ